MKALVIGASGLIGNNVLKVMKEAGHSVLGTHFSYETKDTTYLNTLDLNDERNPNLNDLNPDLVVHCGALTWVDYCEENEKESFQKTVTSCENALKVASKFNSDFVYISTDYVFDGKNGPYSEQDEINPLSVYGKHKLQAEKLVQTNAENNIIVRVTNVYGDEERGKNFIARIIEKAKNQDKDELRLPSDQYATPVNAYDVARAILALHEGRKAGIYHLGSTDLVNRVQLAKLVLKYFPENQMSIIPVVTSELKQKADRPLMGGLISQKFLEEFPDFEFTNVDDYIKKQI